MPNWSQVLQEIDQDRGIGQQHVQGAVDIVRRKYLALLHQKTQRNIIAYYSGWLSKPDASLQTEINDEDKNGFMMAVHGVDVKAGLDLILHTPGGDIAATESIVDYLQRKFGRNIRCIVPQIAMSAGTMIACCSKEILMTRHSNLGPIDPHVRGIPARGLISEIERAIKEIKDDPDRATFWRSIFLQIHPTFLSQCENAVKWSEGFVRRQLAVGMLKGKTNAAQLARTIVKKLSAFQQNRSHSRHIHFDECRGMGLNVTLLEDDPDPEFQDLVLTVHHCYMHALMNSAAFKIIENHMGAALVKQVNITQRLVPVSS